MKAKVQSLFGEVLKTFGTNGELLIKLSDHVPADVNIEEPMFVLFDGLQVPFYFKRFEPRGRKAVVVFEDMETEALASELLGKKIMFYAKGKPVKEQEVFELSSLIGFTITDHLLGELGPVIDFYDYPGNPCLGILYLEKEVLIPIHENLIKSIDPKTKKISTNLPEGLLDL